MAVDEVSHVQSLINYSSVFCSAKSTLSHLRVRASRGLRVHRTLIQYPRFRFATHKGRLCVPEPAGETVPHSGEGLSSPWGSHLPSADFIAFGDFIHPVDFITL